MSRYKQVSDNYMKLIPFYKIRYRVNLMTEEELEKILFGLIKPDTQSTSFLTLPNTDKLYQGKLNIEKNEFSLIRNYGLAYGSNIIQAKGSYRTTGNKIEIILNVRPYYIWLSSPFILLIAGFIFANNIIGPFILFLISYLLICIIPINLTGQRMTEDLPDKLGKHLVETVDLTTNILKL